MYLFFGGSFDPIHIAHLILARDVKETFNFKKVIFIPTYISPFKVKKGHRASAKDRVKMIKLAIKDIPYFDIDTYEVNKKGISYTLYTARYLKARYRLKRVPWLMGDDSFLQFHKWYKWEKLLKILKPIIVIRNYSKKEIENYARKVLKLSPNYLTVYTGRRIEISSTEIRRRLKEGRDIKFLVPEEVEAYIRKRKLYI